MVRPADLRFDDQIDTLFDDVASLGRPDAVVFNAGAQHRQPFLEIEPVMFEKVWRLGCRAGFVVGQAAAKQMVEHGRGTIIFTGPGARRSDEPAGSPLHEFERALFSGGAAFTSTHRAIGRLFGRSLDRAIRKDGYRILLCQPGGSGTDHGHAESIRRRQGRECQHPYPKGSRHSRGHD